MTITEKLAEFNVQLNYKRLPNDVIQEAKLCLLDSLGCILAGAQTDEIVNLSNFLKRSTTDEVSPILGLNQKSSLLYSSILNGSMAHAVELDDVHKEAKSHAGAVVVPAVLTYGSYINATGKDLITSIVAGYETMLRIGKGINATKHRMKGWHATGTCGTFGSAAGISRLLNFDKDQTVHALGLAGTQSSGLWAFTANGANSKMFHAGSAVASGLLSTMLVGGGLTGANRIIEAEDGGLFRSSSEDYSYESVLDGLGETFFITDITRKPYACCRSMHPPIEAAIRLRSQIINLEEIESIKVYTYEVAKVQCGYTNKPQNTTDARFSIPYGVAVALVDGQALMKQFSLERITDEKIIDLAQKVEVVVDEKFDHAYPRNWGCALEVNTRFSTHYEVIQDAKGDPQNPLTQEEIEDKFIYMARDLVGESRSQKIIKMVSNLENVKDITALIDLCSN